MLWRRRLLWVSWLTAWFRWLPNRCNHMKKWWHPVLIASKLEFLIVIEKVFKPYSTFSELSSILIWKYMRIWFNHQLKSLLSTLASNSSICPVSLTHGNHPRYFTSWRCNVHQLPFLQWETPPCFFSASFPLGTHFPCNFRHVSQIGQISSPKVLPSIDCRSKTLQFLDLEALFYPKKVHHEEIRTDPKPFFFLENLCYQIDESFPQQKSSNFESLMDLGPF